MTLIPRRTFFDNADKLCVRLSPDGTQLAYIGPYEGTLNIFLAPVDNLAAARALTKESGRGIRSFSWLYTSRHLVYTKDKDGDENSVVRLFDIESNRDKALTPLEGVQGRIGALSRDFPTKLMLCHNERTKQFFDVFSYDIDTGACELVYENPEFVDFVFNENLEIFYASLMNPDGSMSYFNFAQGAVNKDHIAEHVPYDDVIGTNPVAFTRDGKTLYWLDSRQHNTCAVVKHNLTTGEKETLAIDQKSDIDRVVLHPETRNFEGYSATYGKQNWTIVCQTRQKDFDFLQENLSGEIEIVSKSLDDQRWIVVTHGDRVPVDYFLYQRDLKEITHLFVSHESLKGLALNAMHDVYIKTRDGLELVSFLTLPQGSSLTPGGTVDVSAPLVLNVHGGPQARDYWGYDPVHQWLSNRGYAVLSVNYRSSTGFGKKFRNSGDGEWSRKMHDDLLDAVEWAVAQGITTRDKVCIYGGSYGGYAALVGLTFTPDVFACAVDIVGPSNLETLLQSIPSYWKPIVKMLERRLGGNLDCDQGKKELMLRSPIHKAGEIIRPLLIGQGANDPRVKQAESDQIVETMAKANIPVTYALFPDEGHGFARPENRYAFFAIMEAFLAKHLGGAFEPIDQELVASTCVLKKLGPELEEILGG